MYMIAHNMSLREVHRPTPWWRLLDFQGDASLAPVAQPGWMPVVLPPLESGHVTGRGSVWLWNAVYSITTDMPKFIETSEVTCSFYTFTLNMRKLNMERWSSLLKGMWLPQGHIACRGSNSWQWPILLRSSNSSQIFQGMGVTTYIPQETTDLVTFWSAGSACFRNSLPVHTFFWHAHSSADSPTTPANCT